MKPLKHTLLAVSLLALSAPVAMAQTTITIWGNDVPNTDPSVGPVGASAVLAKEFDDLRDDVTVVYRQVSFDDVISEALRAYATGQAPDIINLDNPNHAAFASRGVFLDLTDRFEASDVIHPEDFFEGPMAAISWEGRYYGLPKGTDTLGLYYNADLFEKAGITEPPQTWDELLDAARKLNDPASGVYGLTFSARANENGTFQFLPWVQMKGANFDSINTDGAVEALTFWKTFLAEGLSSPDVLTQSQTESTNTFIAGNAAMAVTGNWEINRMASDTNFNWGVTMLPTPEDGQRSSALGGWTWGVFETTKSPDAAYDFLEYTVTQADRFYPEFSLLAPISSVKLEPTGDERKDTALAVFLEQLNYAKPRGPHPEWQRISTAIFTALQAAMTGAATPREALDTAAATISGIVGK